MTSTTGWHVTGPAGTLFVDDGGPDRGPLPVVLAHSFGGSSAQWAPQLEHLRRTRRAIAFDLRAHGASTAPQDGDLTVESLAADVGAVLDGLGLGKVVLVGHGLGAKATLEYAAAHPDRVAGLVLAAAPAWIPQEQASQMIAGLRQDYARLSGSINERLLAGAGDEVRTLIANDAARVRPDDAMRIIEASLTHDPRPALGRYHGPLLAVTTPGADTPNDIHHLTPDGSAEVMTGTSHWMQLDQPETFNRILDRFLERVDAS